MTEPVEYVTPHFRRSEMQCPCCRKCEMHTRFMGRLETLRIELDHPIIINSGFRCPEHNAKLPGSSPRSLHMSGMAADISWDEYSPEKKKTFLAMAVRLFGGVGVAKTYLHVDIGPSRLWVY